MSFRLHSLALSSLAALTPVALWLTLKWGLCSTAACAGVQQFGISKVISYPAHDTSTIIELSGWCRQSAPLSADSAWGIFRVMTIFSTWF